MRLKSKILAGFLVLASAVIIVAVLFMLVPSVKIEVLNLGARMGLGDKLALNPEAKDYFNQIWERRTINLLSEGVSKLQYTDANGVTVREVYPNNSFVMITNYENVHNPTMAELKAFLEQDHTNNLVYSDPSCVCANFAAVLHDNAEENGIRCGYVCIDFAVGSGHALDAFQTTDDGLVFVDDTGTPQGNGVDKFDKINIGSEISTVPIFRSDYFISFTMPNSGPITDGTIFW